MEVREIVTAHLTHEDVCQAIAEFASKYRAGDFAFDPKTVRITGENEADEIEIEATVKRKE
jgi:hypothetical protein